MKYFFLISFLLTSALSADVVSTEGQIKFDVQSDNQAEMTLNANGLGIGITPSSNLHVKGNTVVTDQLSVGGSNGSANLNINGTLGHSVQTISSNTTLDENSIVLVDSSSDNITITLPYAGNVTGRLYQIKKISTSNSVWVSGGGNLIDDTSPIELPASNNLASVDLISDGRQWYKLEQKDISETVAIGNLIAWWKLDESSGNTANDSVQSNHGTLQNGLVFSSNTSKFSNALGFDGNNDYIDAGSNAALLAGEPHSISAWIRPDVDLSAMANWRGVVTRGFFDGIIRNHSSGNTFIAYTTHTGGVVPATSSTIILSDTWYHLVSVVSDSNISFYINGIQEGTTALPNPLTTPATTNHSGNIQIGAHRLNYTEFFDGIIDDVRFYNKVLTPAEIQALYSQGQ